VNFNGYCYRSNVIHILD